MRPITGSNGIIVPSWSIPKPASPIYPLTHSRFDVLGFDTSTRSEDEPSLSGVASINTLITSEIKEHGIPPERIVVGELRQGGALACLTEVISERRLAGVFVLSAYVPPWRNMKEANLYVQESFANSDVRWNR
jgi:predicted esterase